MKILAVDDEKDIKLLFQQQFRLEIRSGQLNFTFSYSGEDALQYLNDHKHNTVLILSDIYMPGMSGLEILDRIKQNYRYPSPIVMMITAYGDDINYKTAKVLGADDIPTKPVDFKMLKTKIKSLAHD